MLELRLPPPELVDEQHLSDVRTLIAEVVEVQKRNGNRAGNQAIIDGLGVDVLYQRDEAYCGEAIAYHLGLLYAHLGEPELAARYFELSGTHPGEGGHPVYSEHERRSMLLREHQERARERAIPSILIASMPRSASASLSQTLAALLDVPIMRLSCGRYPSFYVIPRWLNSFSPGGAVSHDHFGAIPFNLETLRAGNIPDVFVRVRDPRSACASSVQLSDRKFRQEGRTDYEDRMVRLYQDAYIPWFNAWIAAASDPGAATKVHWLAQTLDTTGDATRQILSTLAEKHPALEPYSRAGFAEIRANFVSGDDEAWRTRISPQGHDRLWDATPEAVRDLLGLRR